MSVRIVGALTALALALSVPAAADGKSKRSSRKAAATAPSGLLCGILPGPPTVISLEPLLRVRITVCFF